MRPIGPTPGNTRYPSNEETGVQAYILQDPGQHAGGTGLAVGTGHRQHPALLQYMVPKPLWPRGVGQIAVQNIFDAGIAATWRCQ